MVRRLLSHLAAAGLLALLAVGSAAPASAHGLLDQSLPADGSVVEAMPSELVLLFNEPVTLPGEPVRLLDASGAKLPVGQGRVEPSGEGSRVTIPIEGSSGQGWHAATWNAISSDGHPISGTVVFSVGTPPGDAVVAPAEPEDPTETLRRAADPLRGLTYLLTLLAIGALTALWCVQGSGDAIDRVRGRLRKLAVGSALAGIATVPAGIVLQAVILNGGSTSNLGLTLRIVMQTSTGVSSLARASALFAICAAVPLLAEKGSRKAGWVVAAAGSIALAGTYTMAGHTAIVDLRWLAGISLVVHLFAAGAWLGALPGLGFLALTRKPIPLADMAATMKRFSQVATASLAAVLVAGSILTYTMMTKVDDLWTTDYGITLLVKVGIVFAAALAGAVNHFAVVPLLVRQAGNAASGEGSSPSPDAGEGGTGPGAEGNQSASPGIAPSSDERDDLAAMLERRLPAGSDPQRHARRSLRIESAFLVAVLSATAWLTTSGAPQAGGNHLEHLGLSAHHGGGMSANLSDLIADDAPRTVLAAFGDGEMQVDYQPGRADAENEITLTATDANGNIAQLDELAVQFKAPQEAGMGPIDRTPTRNEDGTWTIVTRDLGLPGYWTLHIVGKKGLAAHESTLEIEIRKGNG